MFLLPEVAEAIGLSPATVQQIHKLAAETNAKAAELSKRQQAGEAMETIVREQQALTANERKNVVQLLSMSQKSRIQALTGKPFAFETLRRQLPEPPELDAKDAQWLQGSPTTLKQLRGKVVVVHFYAFQCINCQRNLPHYAAWYRDFADQGLEVIGIQTPETQSERDATQVANAANNQTSATACSWTRIRPLATLGYHDVAPRFS